MFTDQQTVGTFLSSPKTFDNARQNLGSGCFGNVNRSTIPGFVVKTVKDFWVDGWFPWALYCMKHQGEVGIPTIVAMRVDFTSGILWALMEELKEVGFGEKAPTMRCNKSSFEREVSKCFGRLKTAPQHLRAVLQALPDQNFVVDLHRYNSMMRGKKVIITDPFTLTDKNNRWLQYGGPNSHILALKWARQTLDTFMPKPDPRIVVVGSPEERMASLGAIVTEREEQKKPALKPAKVGGGLTDLLKAILFEVNHL